MGDIVCRSFRGPKLVVGLECSDKSLAVQASKDECDINVIVKKYLRTGEMPEQRRALYADISEIKDLATHLQQAMDAQMAFDALPADVRRYFDNDPVKLVQFSMDDRNYDKAAELGLVVPKVKKPSTSPSQPSQGQAATRAAAPSASSGQVSEPAVAGPHT